MKRDRIIYWIATGLLTLQMLFSAGMYVFNHEAISQAFITFGYPAYLVYPLAVAKILGLVAILTRKSPTLLEWAYAGFFFDFVLALAAHLHVGDGQFGGAVIALVLLFVSYAYQKKAFVPSVA